MKGINVSAAFLTAGAAACMAISVILWRSASALPEWWRLAAFFAAIVAGMTATLALVVVLVIGSLASTRAALLRQAESVSPERRADARAALTRERKAAILATAAASRTMNIERLRASWRDPYAWTGAFALAGLFVALAALFDLNATYHYRYWDAGDSALPAIALAGTTLWLARGIAYVTRPGRTAAHRLASLGSLIIVPVLVLTNAL
ncbi:MAG: hypothetical protein GIW95_08205 [Candidatus Eremiobacteraeota bacterium]|nr:hypothetical protein [Candidatus Eremiobacteraeota bacterium]